MKKSNKSVKAFRNLARRTRAKARRVDPPVWRRVAHRIKEQLAKLVTIECGKIIAEGLGEVQEMIDICDFAVGLSRQLHGLTIASERPQHVMQETWHPLGPYRRHQRL